MKLTEDEKRLFELMEEQEKYQYYKSVPPSCKNCPQHPINGGSGNCNCILGSPQITC